MMLLQCAPRAPSPAARCRQLSPWIREVLGLGGSSALCWGPPRAAGTNKITCSSLELDLGAGPRCSRSDGPVKLG